MRIKYSIIGLFTLISFIICAEVKQGAYYNELAGQKQINNDQKDPLIGGGAGCPLCDSSVYSYCSRRLFHDACCCNPPAAYGNGIGTSFQCQYTDCSFIHANSCYEHNLIVTCCCYAPY